MGCTSKDYAGAENSGIALPSVIENKLLTFDLVDECLVLFDARTS